MEAQYGGAAASGRNRRRNRRAEAAPRQEDECLGLTASYGSGDGPGDFKQGRGRQPRSSEMGVVHHHPPMEMSKDGGYPAKGGQTLLIAYFPWEASEEDIELEFSKFSRVKRVHLVVDKSSRKARCFGFVKFISKVDAEEALRATMLGLVQLSDARGHVWHLKAEWTKSGDMVVDDSDAEQEVARRKEERKTRQERDHSDGSESPKDKLRVNGGELLLEQSQSSRSSAGGSKKGLAKMPLQAGVAAPLLPLHQRYHSLNQLPMMQVGPPGVPPVPSLLTQHAVSQQAAQQQHHQMYGATQSLPMYGAFPGQPLLTPPPYPGPLMSGAHGEGPPRSPPASDAPSPAGVSPQPPLRDLLDGASGYGAPHHVYGTPHNSYPSQPVGYAPSSPPQSGYIGQQGAYLGQASYSSQQSAAAASYAAGQQAAYVAAASSPQGAYAASHQAYAAAQQPAYPPAYAPQPSYGAPQPGIPLQPGYASSPPNYALQAQVYGQPGAYGTAPHFAGAYLGLPGVAQPNMPPHVGPLSPGPYSYSQQHLSAHVAADVPYPGHMPPATGLQPMPLQGHPPEEVTNRASVATGYASQPQDLAAMPAVSVDQQVTFNQNLASPAAGNGTGPSSAGVYSLPETTFQDSTVPAIVAQQQRNGLAAQVVLVASPLDMQQCVMTQSAPPAPAELVLQQPDAGDVPTASYSSAMQATSSTAATTPSPSKSSVCGPEQEYLEHMFMQQYSEMSIHDKADGTASPQQPMPTPPVQQPPNSPGGTAGQWETDSYGEGAQSPPTPQGHSDWKALPTRLPATGGRSALWNSFDDAAAKGMVDGLVGEDGIPAPNWVVHNASA